MEYYPLPQPEEIPEREKEDAMGAYLMMFAAVAIGLPLPVINLIAAIVYFYLNKSKSRFVYFHSLQSLLSQIPTTLINWALVIWSLNIFFTDRIISDEFIAYAIVAGIANIFYFIFSLIAAFKARKGKMYYFLLFGKLSYGIVFKMKENEMSTIENKPPF